MKHLSRLLSTALALAAGTTVALAESPRVVATIKPIHSLVASVMGETGTPDLIVRGGASPHTYSLRPSDAAALEAANVVFWTGHGMELFLEDTLDSLAGDAKVVELADSPGVTLLAVREGGVFEAHEHDADDDHEAHDHEAHDDPANHGDHADHDDHDGHDDHGEMDMHFWLDPANAVLMTRQIATALSAADPENADAYAENAAAAIARLEALAAEIDATLAPVREAPFIVFHDAYQYFERRFDLAIAGSITVTPDTMPGAGRVGAIRGRIADLGAACVFAEPQFEPAIIATIVEGTGVQTGTLDPEGAGLAEGPELYAELLRALAASIAGCLSAAAP